LVGFLILSLLVIFGASFMSAFLDQTTVGAAETDLDLKLIKDICVTTISIFGMLITIFISASVVPNEVENKVIYTVLSKPVRRMQYLLGKFIGVQMIVLANLLLMAGLFFAAIWIKQEAMPTLLLWSVLLTYFEFLVVSAFTFAVSCTSTSAVLPTIAGLFIYMTGNLTEYLKDVNNRSREATDFFQRFVGEAAEWLYNILPNLQKFSLKNYILDLQPNDPLPSEMMDQIPNLVLYGLAYAIAGYLIAYWVFRRKEL
jgi:ABC-type transport system involved in multi-copper enzyme maturation permease subunit